MTDQELQLQKRVKKYEQIKKETPVFLFMQEVNITDGFYKWYNGRIYKELDFMLHPDQENNKDEWVVTTYEVIIYEDINEETENVIDRRLVEAKYMIPLE